MNVQSDAFIRKGDNVRGELDGDLDLTIRIGKFTTPNHRHPYGSSLTLFVTRDALATIADDLETLAKLARQTADAQKACGVIEAKPGGRA